MSFSYKKSVAVDHTQCGSSDSTDFPVTIWVTDADLKTIGNGGKVQHSSGYDIRPFADSGLSSALTFELVPGTYDPTTGALEMHVKIPTVSCTVDTVFYLAFGDSGISTDGSSTATWSNGFVGVWHLPNGSSLSFSDSTTNGNTLTGHGTPTAGTGEIDGGMVLASVSNQYADTTAMGTAFDSSVHATVSFWGNRSSTGNNLVAGFGHQGSRFNIIVFNDGNTYNCVEAGIFNANFPSYPFSGTGWHFFALTYDGGNAPNSAAIAYHDATQDLLGGQSSPSTLGTAAGLADFQVGAETDGPYYSDGTLDEVRIVNATRSADWLLAEYNNQKPSSTFLTWGPLTSNGKRFFLIPG